MSKRELRNGPEHHDDSAEARIERSKPNADSPKDPEERSPADKSWMKELAVIGIGAAVATELAAQYAAPYVEARNFDNPQLRNDAEYQQVINSEHSNPTSPVLDRAEDRPESTEQIDPEPLKRRGEESDRAIEEMNKHSTDDAEH